MSLRAPAGSSCEADSFALPLARRLESWIVGTGVIGALAMVLWILVKGVDEQRWQEQASAHKGDIT